MHKTSASFLRQRRGRVEVFVYYLLADVSVIVYLYSLLTFIKEKLLKGCGEGSDEYRLLTAYGTATKAGQELIKAIKNNKPSLFHSF